MSMTEFLKKYVLPAVMSVVFTIIVLELLFTFVHVESDIFHQPDSVYGASLIPNKDGWYVSKEFSNFKKVNFDGFVDAEYSEEAPENTIRIAVIGDSFVEALQVPLNETFHKIAEDKLNTEFGNKSANFEVLSFGVSNFGTVQEYILLKEKVLKYNPDVVVLMIFPGNDVAGNSDEIDPNTARPYFETTESGELVKNSNGDIITKKFEPLKRGLVSETASKSKLAVFLYNSIRRIQLADSTSVNEIADYTDGVYIFTPNQSTEWKVAWNITENILVEMKNLSEESGAEFIVIGIPHPLQVQEEFSHKDVAGFDQNYPDKILQAMLERNNVSYVISTDELATYHNLYNETLFFPKDGHFTEHGHEAMADIIFKKLQ